MLWEPKFPYCSWFTSFRIQTHFIEGRIVPWKHLVPFSLQGLTDHPEGQASRITLAGKHPGQPTGPLLRRQAPRGLQPPADKTPRGTDLGLGAKLLIDGRPDLRGVNPTLLELGTQRSPGQAAAIVPRFHPGPGESGVVDQADILKPAEHLVGCFIRYAPLAQRVG